jgi:hypothetical protein
MLSVTYAERHLFWASLMLSVTGDNQTLYDTSHYVEYRYAECRFAECR